MSFNIGDFGLTPSDVGGIISEGLGQYLYANHPAFMPVQEGADNEP